MSHAINQFILEVSRGGLKVIHVSTYDFVKAALCYVKNTGQKTCCQKQLICALTTMNNYFDFGCFTTTFMKRLSNVVLNGLHKLERDMDTNSTLYQTTIKRARLCGT